MFQQAGLAVFGFLANGASAPAADMTYQDIVVECITLLSPMVAMNDAQ